MTDERIEISVIPTRRLYPRPHEEYNDFGIFACNIDDSDYDKVEQNIYGNIIIKGSMPDLKIGSTYITTVVKRIDPERGVGYEVIIPPYMKPFTTLDEQRLFLSVLLTERQINSIVEAYPNENLVDLIKQDRLDVSIIKGIGEVTLQKIKDKISKNEKYQLAIIKLTGQYEIPYNSVVKLSDKYGSPDILIDKIEVNPYILTEVEGFGFTKVDEIALKMGVDKDSKDRILSCVEYILEEQSNEGHCWMRLVELIGKAVKLLNLTIDKVKEIVTDKENMKKYSVDENEKKIYLNRYHYFECQIKDNVFRILNDQNNHKVKNIDQIIESIEDKQGFKFTIEQRTAIDYAVNHNVMIVNGKAGTGKTSVIKGIVEVLKSITKTNMSVATADDIFEGISNSEKSYATCALSGKASQRIQESTGLDSYTIHRLLNYNPNLGWLYNKDNPMPYDIIILDEASMVNSELFYYLLRAIKNGAKIIITGDTAQLEPIGVGNVLIDLIESEKIPKVELTIVHRQAQKSAILSCANMVRDGKHFVSYKDLSNVRLGELKDLYLYPHSNGDKVFDRVISIAIRYNGNILDFQIIVPMKKRGKNSSKNINNECQKIFNIDPEEVEDNKKISRKDCSIVEGDKVILNGNNYNKEVFNGTIGIVKYINNSHVENGENVGEIVVDFEGIGAIRLTKSEAKKLDLAYCITIHKSQGSQWKYVVFAMDYSSYILLNRQLVYTAMTRASEALFMPVEVKALKYSINTNKSNERRTFLKDMLNKTALIEK